jgi:hypothetical protein
MPVKVMSGARYVTLGRCLFLMAASAALGEGIGQVLFRLGVPRAVALFGFSVEWTGFLIATIFMIAFHVFSTPVESREGVQI